MRSLTSDGARILLRVADGSITKLRTTMPCFATEAARGADGRTAYTLDTTGDSLVTWATDGHVLSLTGAATPDALIGIRHDVRAAVDPEWRGLLFSLRPDFRIGEFVQVADGTTPVGTAWSAGIQLATRDRRTLYSCWWTSPGRLHTSASALSDTDLATSPAIEVLVVNGGTYAFISVPAAIDARSASVTAADGTITDVPLVQPFPNVPVRAGVTFVEAPGTIEVAIGGLAQLTY